MRVLGRSVRYRGGVGEDCWVNDGGLRLGRERDPSGRVGDRGPWWGRARCTGVDWNLPRREGCR